MGEPGQRMPVGTSGVTVPIEVNAHFTVSQVKPALDMRVGVYIRPVVEVGKGMAVDGKVQDYGGSYQCQSQPKLPPPRMSDAGFALWHHGFWSGYEWAAWREKSSRNQRALQDEVRQNYQRPCFGLRPDYSKQERVERRFSAASPRS